PGERVALRATLDVDDGNGNHVVTFYSAPTIAGPWIQLGDPQIASGTTSIFSGNADLCIGSIDNESPTAPTVQDTTSTSWFVDSGHQIDAPSGDLEGRVLLLMVV